MISGWLVKIVLGIALIGFLIIELGSPLIARFQADDAAHDAANDARREFLTTRSVEEAEAAAVEAADNAQVNLDKFLVDERGIVHLTVTKQAKSLVLHRISAVEDWFDVTVSVTSDVTPE